MWTTVESMFYPELIDSTTSRNWIYVRKNIREEQRADEETGETVTVYIVYLVTNGNCTRRLNATLQTSTISL